MNKERFLITGLGGKKTLKGVVSAPGAKNAVLKLIASSFLFDGPIEIRNVPDIEDVARLLEIVRAMGVVVTEKKNALILDPRELSTHILPRELSKTLRSSIVLTGPTLARMHKVNFPHPGGCVIGSRPVDLFLEGFEALGARIKETTLFYSAETNKGVSGGDFFFRTPSVTGTETLMMAAVLGQGVTRLENVAMEPEIIELAQFLNDCGAHIEGAGTPTIIIRGTKGKLLRARKPVVTPPDRIDVGSFVILGALAGKDVRIVDCRPHELSLLLHTLKNCGVPVSWTKTEIRVKAGTKQYKGVDIRTHEYPGFPTDLQAPMTIFLTQAKGESLVFETIFEGRLGYVESLKHMGADIKVMDPHRVIVEGPTPLRGRNLESPDLRAGLAYIIAAIIAKGKSVIHNVYNIDRGYERIEERLRALGVDIERIPE